MGAVHGGTRAEALRWCADYLGMPLADRPFTPRESQHYARRLEQAEREATALAEQRQTLIDDLRKQRNSLWDMDRQVSALAARLIRDGNDDDPRWEVIWPHALDDIRGDDLNSDLGRIERLSPAELRAELARSNAAAARPSDR